VLAALPQTPRAYLSSLLLKGGRRKRGGEEEGEGPGPQKYFGVELPVVDGAKTDESIVN